MNERSRSLSPSPRRWAPSVSALLSGSALHPSASAVRRAQLWFIHHKGAWGDWKLIVSTSAVYQLRHRRRRRDMWQNPSEMGQGRNGGARNKETLLTRGNGERSKNWKLSKRGGSRDFKDLFCPSSFSLRYCLEVSVQSSSYNIPRSIHAATQ